MAQITVNINFTGDTLDALRNLTEALNKANLESLDKTVSEVTTNKQTIAAPSEPASNPDKTETKESEIPFDTAPEVTLTDVRKIAAALAKKNYAALQNILTKHGGPPLTKVPADKLPAVLADVQEALNAK